MNLNIKELQSCRICGNSDLSEVLNLGEIYPSNFVKSTEGYSKAPLVLVKCDYCGLVQLKHTVTPDDMYRQYWYKSNLNKSMVKDLRNIVDNVERLVHLNNDDIVVDIGTNDGTLFNFYTNHNLRRVGFDPALNLAEEARKNCTWFVNDYFSADKYPYAYDKAKVITTIAMFYDLENPNLFIEHIKDILDRDGIWVIQMTDLLSMFKANAFDNICHEHLLYPTLRGMNNLLRNHGLTIFDAEYNYVNGGSIRLYVKWNNSRLFLNWSENFLKDILDDEADYFSKYDYPFKYFQSKINEIKYTTLDYLETLWRYGKKVYGLGASTKGNTVLQLFNITNKLLPAISEINPDKYGLKTIGTNIPILPEKEIEKLNPDVYMVLAWHFLPGFQLKYKNFLDDDGKLFATMPTPREIYNEGMRII